MDIFVSISSFSKIPRNGISRTIDMEIPMFFDIYKYKEKRNNRGKIYPQMLLVLCVI